MTLPFFVVGSEALAADTIELAGDEGRHAVAAKRLQAGERVMLTDGSGHGAECEVISVGRQGLVAQVYARRDAPAPVPRLVVVQAIPKGEHAERAVDLVTEVGADVIVPWAASRCVVRWRGERAEKGLQRWRTTAVAAAKQSRRLRFPTVTDVQTAAEVATLVSGSELALVLHEGAEARLESALDGVAAASEVALVVGPEGGIDHEELDTLAAAGAWPVRFGETVVRSSTAGVVGATTVLSRTSRWR
ncbi:MAG: 16S rRNA (uracil(1498)-N(3))-methyltransferase [Nocardioidaceae bacterium]